MSKITIKNTIIQYSVLCIGFLLITEYFKSILHFDKLLYNSLAEKLTIQQLTDFINLQEKWKWISYVFTPLYILLKTIIMASIIYIGTYFFDKGQDFKYLWNIAIKAEFIYLLVPLFKIVWFYFFQTNYTLEDIQYFFPLSALNIVGYKGLDVWLLYPLQTLNFFELAYIIFLSYQLGYLTNSNADKGLKIVSYSYIPTLFLWVVVVMFFTLNYS